MEVILREHVDNLGRRGDIVKVAEGYARNYLLPRKLALAVTESNKRQIERERQAAEARDAEEKGQAEALAQRLSAVDIEIPRRVGENETLYGSVTSADIAQARTRRRSGSRSASATTAAHPIPLRNWETSVCTPRRSPAARSASSASGWVSVRLV